MAAGRLIFPAYMPAQDANGDRIAGARAYFYLDLSTTLATVYADASLTTPLSNPVEADGVGTWPAIWADTATVFTIALTDANGLPLPNGAWSGASAALDATLASVALSMAAQAAAEAAEGNAVAAQLLAQAAASLVTGAPLSATSATSLTVGAGAKTFTLDQLGKLFTVGETVVIASTVSAVNQMTGIITAFDPVTGIMTVLSSATGGAGTFAAWSVSLSSSGGVLSLAGLTGVITAAAAKAALAIASTDITDFADAVADEAIAAAVTL